LLRVFRRAFIITINSFGTELTKDDREKLYPTCGRLYPDGLKALARADDYDQVVKREFQKTARNFILVFLHRIFLNFLLIWEVISNHCIPSCAVLWNRNRNRNRRNRNFLTLGTGTGTGIVTC
jgi:hypothetical protein